MPDASSYPTFIESQAASLRAKDRAPTSLAMWQTRRQSLREAMFQAMGGIPDKPCELTPKIVGTLKREGYRIEKLLFQSRPDVWVTGSVYVPENVKGKVPAVLVVHGHWAGARRDPVVQARCLGLVKLGFFVLAIDAFSAGERHPTVQRGTYHGGLLGSTLWPAGLSLLGVQVYDNRRAVDYLLMRPEVDGSKLGITGASGGGNQTMYAGALDERFGAVVPVCSIGRYQAYLRAACCVCEVLPGALRLTEEGDVLGLVAPRALMVVNATRDAFQFSVGEAKKSLERTKEIFKLYNKDDRLAHAIFESPHDYNQAMREAMYGWMTRWLKNEGDGKPIPEPKHTVETAEDLACYPGGKRPASFLFPPDLAAREARRLLAWTTAKTLNHKEAWEAQSAVVRAQLEESLGGLPKPGKIDVKAGPEERLGGIVSRELIFTPEPGIEVASTIQTRSPGKKLPTCVLLHFNGRSTSLDSTLAKTLLNKGWAVCALELRATGTAKSAREAAIAGAPDHNSAEHALWIGRPLLGQWVVDVRAMLDVLALRPEVDGKQLALVGMEQAGVVAVVAGGLLSDRLRSVAAIDTLSSYVTSTAYGPGTRMGLLAPGILKAGDLPQIAALRAPGKLILQGAISPEGKKLDAKAMDSAWAFPRMIYGLLKADSALSVAAKPSEPDLVAQL